MLSFVMKLVYYIIYKFYGFYLFDSHSLIKLLNFLFDMTHLVVCYETVIPNVF